MSLTRELCLADVAAFSRRPDGAGPARYFDNRWPAWGRALEADPYQVTDWLAELPGEALAGLLPRVAAAAAGLMGDPGLALPAVAAWRGDLEAAAWCRLHGVLSRSVRDRRAVLAGQGRAELWPELHAELDRLAAIRAWPAAAPPAGIETEARRVHEDRLAAPETAELAGRLAAWAATGPGPAPAETEAALLALALLELEEETARRRVLGLTAGEHGGLAWVEVAGLADGGPRPAGCEPALWSRCGVPPADWQALRQLLSQIESWLPGTPALRFRVALNPPGRAPAGAHHLTAPAAEGGSLGLALALAAYAMQQGMRLHELAAIGQVIDGRIVPVGGVADKVRRLLAFNADAAAHGGRPITHLLVPDGNLAEAEAAAGGALSINQGLQGERIAVRDVADLLQPGVLRDGLEPYCAWLRARLDGVPVAEAEQDDAAHARPLADETLEALAAGQKGHIVPAPYRDPGDTSAVEALAQSLAYRCAEQRLAWGERPFDTEGAVRRRPGAPILFVAHPSGEATVDFESWAVGLVRAGPVALGEDDVREGWRSLDNEFVLILCGPEDLVQKHVAGPLGLLAQMDGQGPREGRHSLVLVASGVHQMLAWRAILEREAAGAGDTGAGRSL